MTPAPPPDPGPGETVDGRWWPFGRFLPLSRRGVRVAIALALVAAAAVGANAVRRAAKGKGSRFDETTSWSRALVIEGEDVYRTRPSEGTHAKYPPAFFVAAAPFSLLPVEPGAIAWYLLHLALALAAIRLAVRAWHAAPGPPPPGQVLLVGALLLPVVATNLSTAQVNLAVVFLLALGLALVAGGRDLAGGIAVGVAAALKVTPALFVLWFLAKRQGRVVLGSAAGVLLAAALLPAAVLGPARAVEVTRSWAHVVLGFAGEGARGEGIGGYRGTNQSLEAAVVRLAADVPAASGEGAIRVNVLDLPLETARGIARGLSVAILLGLAVLCRGKVRDRRGLDVAAQAGLVAIAMLLVSPVSWLNHYAAMLLPFTAAVEAVRRTPSGEPRRRRLAGAAGVASGTLLLGAVAPPTLAFSLPLLGAVALGVALAPVARPGGG